MEIPNIDLPIKPRLGEVVDLLAQRPALVLKAEPGAGKTSLVPIALAEAWPQDGKVVVLEPRRLAAVQSATRAAELIGEKTGSSIGYRVRGDSRPGSRVEFVTEGVFLRMIHEDPSLAGIGSVVFDEFHERSLQADLGLALALDARSAFRPSLRLVIMSATMKVEGLAAFIQGSSIEIEGRSFPVDTLHRPLPDGPGFEGALADLALEILLGGKPRPGHQDIARKGDLLVFLPGVAEIEAVGRCLGGFGSDSSGRPDILALHGGLPLESQRKVITAQDLRDRRRIILATSIAETSLTVPGISAVLDSGLARLTRFEVRSGLNRLVTERESRDRADQRKGRAGRLGPGLCFRAWPQAESLPETTQPEILRAELSALVLEAVAWGARLPKDLPWLDAPPEGAWDSAQDLLYSLGALDEGGRTTKLGLACLRMGTEPRIATMVLKGLSKGRLGDAAGLAALLSERGGAEPDLGLALSALRSGRPDLGSARSEASRLEKAALASAWSPGTELQNESLGALLAAGFPDRVAKRQESGGGKAIFQLPGGRKLNVRGGLSEAAWIVAAEAEAGGGRYSKTGEGRVFSGAALTEEEALAALAPFLTEEQRIDWDGLRARARAVRKAGSIVLSERPLGAPSLEALAQALAKRLAKEGLGILPWEEGGGASLLGRIRWFQDRSAKDGDPWPGITDTYLLESLGQWLLPFIEATSSGPCISPASLRDAVASLIPPGQARAFERDAPASLVLPSGRKARLEYDKDQLGPGGAKIGPSLEARPQDIYGLKHHPTILGFPILIRLVSPAGRPIHLTTDIPGFWKAAWLEVRKDLKGRYPKHDWPEDAAAASPVTTRERPKGGKG